MRAIFIALVNISISAGWAVLAIIVSRLLLRKAPKWIKCLLWTVVAVRLLIPALPQSPVSLIPSTETIVINTEESGLPGDAQHAPDVGSDSSAAPYFDVSVESGIPVINEKTNDIIDGLFSGPESGSQPAAQTFLDKASYVWAAGCGVMVLYAVFSALRVRRTIRESVADEGDVYICDAISSPFIFGVLRPRIYIPSGLPGNARKCVIEHETAHIERKDHLWKPLGFALLCVYWFNPLIWAAYILFCRDIELACDEKAVRAMAEPARAEYSRTLLLCSAPARMVSACPLAFGEGNVKGRVSAVLNYKRPSFWIIIAAVVICGVLAAVLLTDPASGSRRLPLKPPSLSVSAEKDITVKYSGSSWSNTDMFGNGSNVTTDSPGLGNETFREGLKSAGDYKGSCRLDFPVWPDQIDVKLISEDALNSAGPTEEISLQLNEEHELVTGTIKAGTYYAAVHAVWDIAGGRGGYADYYFKMVLYAEFVSSGTYQWFDHLRYQTDGLYYGVRLEEFPDERLIFNGKLLTVQKDRETKTLIQEGFCIQSIFFSDVTGDGLRETCATVTFSNVGNMEYVIVYDHAKDRMYRLRAPGETDYFLFLRGSELCLAAAPYNKMPEEAGMLAITGDKITMSADSEVLTSAREYWNNSYLRLMASSDYSTRNISLLKELYPWMFEYDTADGLIVYISSYAEGQYCGGILPGNAEAVPLSQAATVTLSVIELKSVLAEYGLEDSKISLRPYNDPLSSYGYLRDEAEYKNRISALFGGIYSVGETLMSGTVLAPGDGPTFCRDRPQSQGPSPRDTADGYPYALSALRTALFIASETISAAAAPTTSMSALTSPTETA